MPEITRFFGIVITMYFRQAEHNPPHFHARYGKHAALIDIAALDVLDGSLPPRELLLVKMWAEKHQDGLMAMWHTQKFLRLPPLE